MALSELANEDLKVSYTMTAGPPDKVYGGDQGLSTKLTTTKNAYSKANNKKICTTAIIAVYSQASGAPCPFTSATFTFIVGGGTIVAGATKVKASAQNVLRKNDAGACAGSWVPNGGPPSIPCACTIKISDAGQTKVKGQ